MIIFNVKSLLVARGYKATPYLLTKMGISINNAKRLLNGSTKTLSLKDVEKLCVFLNCTPNDLLNYIPEPDPTGTEGYMLHTLTKNNEDINPIDALKILNHAEMLELNRHIKTLVKK